MTPANGGCPGPGQTEAASDRTAGGHEVNLSVSKDAQLAAALAAEILGPEPSPEPAPPLPPGGIPVGPPADPLPAGAYDGMKASQLAADPWWKEGMPRAIEYLAGTGAHFSADDVRDMVGETDKPSAWGAPFAHAHRREVIEPVMVQPSSRPSRHAGLRRVWVGTHAWRTQQAKKETE